MPAFIDYTNKRIGRVTVLSFHETQSGCSKWNCLCDCGHHFICWSVSFKRGEKFECKECWYERRRGIDLTGRTFGRWTVIKRTVDELNKTKWLCRCDCGKEGLVSGCIIGKQGKSMSCGCLGRKQKSKHINTTLYPPAHGLSKNKFYITRTTLAHKCYNEKSKQYHLYGGKGITFCDLWRNSARDMYDWAIQNGWEQSDILCLKSGEKEFNPETTIILKDSEFRSQIALKGGDQITYQGSTHSVKKWAEILNVNQDALRRKIKKYPSIDEAFNSNFSKITSPEIVDKIVELYKAGKTQIEISKILKIKYGNIRYQLLKNNIELNNNETKKHKRKDVKDEDIILLHQKGMSINSMAKELNCSFPTIKRRLEKIRDMIGQ